MARIFSAGGIRVGAAGRDRIVYWENGRRMTIAGEPLSNCGIAICVCTILSWDDGSGELIDEAERSRILENIKAYCKSHGMRLDLS